MAIPRSSNVNNSKVVQTQVQIPIDMSLFRLLQYGFRFSGLMLYERTTCYLIALVYHWIVHTFGGVSFILELILGNGSLIDKIEVITGIAAYVLTFPKMYVLSKRGKEILQLFRRLENIHNEVSKDPENRMILINAENLGKTLVISFSIFIVFVPSVIFVFKTIQGYFIGFDHKMFFIQVWIPWNTDETWAFLLANVYINILDITYALGFAISTGAYLTFTFQMSACLKVLKIYFETRGPEDKIIYQYHDKLIQIINDYNRIFSGVLYAEALVGPLLPCGYGMTLIRSIKKNHFNELVPHLIKIFGCLSLCVIPLSCGQEVITQVEILHESSYMNNWYEENPKVRRDLLTLMIRTTKPTTVNYRLFVTLNRECLAKVFQGMYSFFMMIISFDS